MYRRHLPCPNTLTPGAGESTISATPRIEYDAPRHGLTATDGGPDAFLDSG
jgi:hypothetical protein